MKPQDMNFYCKNKCKKIQDFNTTKNKNLNQVISIATGWSSKSLKTVLKTNTQLKLKNKNKRKEWKWTNLHTNLNKMLEVLIAIFIFN